MLSGATYKDDTLYYPQDEMKTVLLPVTSGCSYNGCAFCSMYKDVAYRPVPFAEIETELRSGDTYTEKIFLTGADPMSIGFSKMKRLLEMIRSHLPYCARVGAYASIQNIARYSVDELSVLHDAGLRMLYIGFETGRDDVLKMINKGHTVEQAVEAAKKLNQAKLPFNTVVMYGIAGEGECQNNAVATAEMINRFEIARIITMNLVVFYGTDLNAMVKRGDFVPASGKERLLELRTLLEHLKPQKRTMFDTTHPTNIIKMEGELPQDRKRLIEQVKRQEQMAGQQPS